MDREMEHAIFGDSGRLCVAFGPQNGHTYDFRNFGMIDTIAPWIEAGKLRVLCVDSIDEETWSAEGKNERERLELQERWFRYVTDELVPQYLGDERAITTGCSMGAVHAANFFFRRPDIFDTVIALSGYYSSDMFFFDYVDDLVYANSPLHYIEGMPNDHYYVDLYKQNTIIICTGQGAWEDDMIRSTTRLKELLQYKNVDNAWIDFWGHDVNHDWPWWLIQFPYFLKHVLG